MPIKILTLTALLSLGAVSNGVLASGTHAGGRDDGDAIGVPGKAAKVTRTIAVDMTDNMRFKPERISVSRGETIRFKVRNSGKLKHELVLGTKKELEEHYKAMMKFPEMEHEEDNMITLAPAKSGEIVWQFTKSGKVDFACLQPGHYEAGMKGQVIVTAKQKQGNK
ncbi:MAG: cupredoxin family protein [Burkholderiales bacterium]|nr:cupredoxin family protein [Burkholderiales bacterium]